MKIRPFLAAACGFSLLFASCSQTPTPEASEPAAPVATSLPPQLTATEETTPTAAPSLTPEPEPSATPQGSRPDIIGYTVAGRPLTMYRYGDGPSRRLIIAGIHGGYEWNTIALAHQLMSHLTVHPETIPPDVSLYLLPALNPDGEARSSSYEGRANENGPRSGRSSGQRLAAGATCLSTEERAPRRNRRWPLSWISSWTTGSKPSSAYIARR